MDFLDRSAKIQLWGRSDEMMQHSTHIPEVQLILEVPEGSWSLRFVRSSRLMRALRSSRSHEVPFHWLKK